MRHTPSVSGWQPCCGLIRQQDEELDQLGQHVERLGGLGREIHGELESQSRMLDDLVRARRGPAHFWLMPVLGSPRCCGGIIMPAPVLQDGRMHVFHRRA